MLLSQNWQPRPRPFCVQKAFSWKSINVLVFPVMKPGPLFVFAIPVLWLFLAILVLHQYTRGCERETTTLAINQAIESPRPQPQETQTNDICVLTYFDGRGKMAGWVGELSMGNKKRYCEMHNYL